MYIVLRKAEERANDTERHKKGEREAAASRLKCGYNTDIY